MKDFKNQNKKMVLILLFILPQLPHVNCLGLVLSTFDPTQEVEGGLTKEIWLQSKEEGLQLDKVQQRIYRCAYA